MQIYLIFYILLLELVLRTVKLDIIAEIENEEPEYEVEAIFDFKLAGKNIEYLIKWKSYLYEENTWEFKKYLKNC